MPADEPIRLTSTGGSGRPVAVAVAVAAVLILGLVKPWGGGGAPAPAPSSAAPASSAARPAPRPAATAASAQASASLDRTSNIGGPCYYGLAWRLFTTETSDVGPVHTWYALLPVAASGPADPRIETVHVHSTTVGQLGYCSVHLPGASGVLGTQAWRLIPGQAVQALVLDPAVGTTTVDPAAGAIYAPPAGVWTAARYVFAVRLASNPTVQQWFAVDIS